MAGARGGRGHGVAWGQEAFLRNSYAPKEKSHVEVNKKITHGRIYIFSSLFFLFFGGFIPLVFVTFC